MSEKKNSLEEKRILQKKLQWYTLEAEDGEFNATEVEAMLELSLIHISEPTRP